MGQKECLVCDRPLGRPGRRLEVGPRRRGPTTPPRLVPPPELPLTVVGLPLTLLPLEQSRSIPTGVGTVFPTTSDGPVSSPYTRIGWVGSTSHSPNRDPGSEYVCDG